MKKDELDLKIEALQNKLNEAKTAQDFQAIQTELDEIKKDKGEVEMTCAMFGALAGFTTGGIAGGITGFIVGHVIDNRLGKIGIDTKIQDSNRFIRNLPNVFKTLVESHNK